MRIIVKKRHQQGDKKDQKKRHEKIRKNLQQKNLIIFLMRFFLNLFWRYLTSQAVTNQVFSAPWTLLPYSEWERVFPHSYTHQKFFITYM